MSHRGFPVSENLGIQTGLFNPSSTKPVLQLLPLAVPQCLHLLLGHVVGARDLVERVVRVLLELLADLVDLLLPPQTLLILHLVQPLLLKRVVSGLESALGMTVDLVVVVLGEVQSIESIVDTGCVESGEFLLAGRTIETREIEATGLLDWRLLAGLAW